MTIQRDAGGTYYDARSRVAFALRSKPKDRPFHNIEKLTLRQITKRLSRVLEREKIAPGLDYIGTGGLSYVLPECQDMTLRALLDYRWVACYAVTGSNEGEYVHVSLVAGGDDRRSDLGKTRLVLNIKTFGGMEEAQRIAARCATLLGA